MPANAIETVGRTALDALREGVASVLAEQSGSTALHAFIDGKRALDRELWQQATVLGWLGVAAVDDVLDVIATMDVEAKVIG
jgi:hypothetical protein